MEFKYVRIYVYMYVLNYLFTYEYMAAHQTTYLSLQNYASIDL